MAAIPSSAFVVLAAGVIAATVIDLKTRRIPNALTAAMTAAGIALAVSGMSGMPVKAAAIGFVIGLVLMLPGYALGATGAGDVKLMAAIGAIVGPGLVVVAFLCTALAGGVLAVIVAIRRQRLGATMRLAGKLAGGGGREQIQGAPAAHRFAYGPAIAAGTLIAMFVS